MRTAGFPATLVAGVPSDVAYLASGGVADAFGSCQRASDDEDVRTTALKTLGCCRLVRTALEWQLVARSIPRPGRPPSPPPLTVATGEGGRDDVSSIHWRHSTPPWEYSSSNSLLCLFLVGLRNDELRPSATKVLISFSNVLVDNLVTDRT